MSGRKSEYKTTARIDEIVDSINEYHQFLKTEYQRNVIHNYKNLVLSALRENKHLGSVAHAEIKQDIDALVYSFDLAYQQPYRNPKIARYIINGIFNKLRASNAISSIQCQQLQIQMEQWLTLLRPAKLNEKTIAIYEVRMNGSIKPATSFFSKTMEFNVDLDLKNVKTIFPFSTLRKSEVSAKTVTIEFRREQYEHTVNDDLLHHYAQIKKLEQEVAAAGGKKNEAAYELEYTYGPIKRETIKKAVEKLFQPDDYTKELVVPDLKNGKFDKRSRIVIDAKLNKDFAEKEFKRVETVFMIGTADFNNHPGFGLGTHINPEGRNLGYSTLADACKDAEKIIAHSANEEKIMWTPLAGGQSKSWDTDKLVSALNASVKLRKEPSMPVSVETSREEYTVRFHWGSRQRVGAVYTDNFVDGTLIRVQKKSG